MDEKMVPDSQCKYGETPDNEHQFKCDIIRPKRFVDIGKRTIMNFKVLDPEWNIIIADQTREKLQK